MPAVVYRIIYYVYDDCTTDRDVADCRFVSDDRVNNNRKKKKKEENPRRLYYIRNTVIFNSTSSSSIHRAKKRKKKGVNGMRTDRTNRKIDFR